MKDQRRTSQVSAASAETVKQSNWEGSGGKQVMVKSSEPEQQSNAKESGRIRQLNSPDPKVTFLDLAPNDKLSTLSQPINPELLRRRIG
jgi:hypothetical protein